MYDILIIGAGVTGSFIARELARYKLKILVLEKDLDVGNETTAANSAIVHSGYDPVPGTLKAKLNVRRKATRIPFVGGTFPPWATYKYGEPYAPGQALRLRCR